VLWVPAFAGKKNARSPRGGGGLEVQFFLKTGGDSSNIIRFIVQCNTV
jgi:hypothetical protein